MGSRGLPGKHIPFFIRNSGLKVNKIAEDLCIKAGYTMGHDQDIGPEGEVFILKIYIDFMKLQIIKYLFP